jgi:hypothetical protein
MMQGNEQLVIGVIILVVAIANMFMIPALFPWNFLAAIIGFTNVMRWLWT